MVTCCFRDVCEGAVQPFDGLCQVNETWLFAMKTVNLTEVHDESLRIVYKLMKAHHPAVTNSTSCF